MVFDHYMKGNYGAMKSCDGISWEEAKDIDLAKEARYGSVFVEM